MIDPRKAVLIGDYEDSRVHLLREILLREFEREIVATYNFDDLKAKVRDAERDGASWLLVLVAYDLPASAFDRTKILPVNINGLKTMIDPAIKLGCIHSTPEKPNADHVTDLHYIKVPLQAATKAEHDHIILLLEQASNLKRASPPPKMYLTPDRLLREQIRGLNDARDLAAGGEDLSYLIRNLGISNGANETKVALAKLVQGRSGARVFRFRPRMKPASGGDLIIKLNTRSDRWKLELEVERHSEAIKSLGVQDYQIHVAKLKEVDSACKTTTSKSEYIVEYGNWCAICYDFLGGRKFGQFLDLETAIVASPQRLQTKTKGIAGFEINTADEQQVINVRKRVLTTMLDWLCKTWYQNKDHVSRAVRQIWQSEDRDTRDYPVMPPYRLAGKNKGRILSFLDSQETAIGGRFFDDWPKRLHKVRRFVDWRRKDNSFFSREFSIVLSPAHGDLNANNIMLWLKEPRPFLIDFPCYQENGHALQDLASLEVAIKFALMDRQEHSPKERLQAFDHTHSQMDIWQEMDDYLLSGVRSHPANGWLRQHCHTENVALCFDLVGLLRERAEAVQTQMGKEGEMPSFLDEYLSALLYHTVRAIGYDSLSVFKRLLAVYSTSAILDKLGFDSSF